jgi:hypothetical protein
MWQNCPAALLACGSGNGAVAGSGTCADGLRCRAGADGDLARELTCLRAVRAEDLGLLMDAVHCLETEGAAGCATLLEKCACRGLTNPPAADAKARCNAAMSTCPIAGPCSRTVCLSLLAGAPRKVAGDLLACVDAKCPGCAGAGCDNCVAVACAAEVSACQAQ